MLFSLFSKPATALQAEAEAEEEMGSSVPVLTMACPGSAALEWDLECPCCFPLSLLQGSGCSPHSQPGGLSFCWSGPGAFFHGKDDGKILSLTVL